MDRRIVISAVAVAAGLLLVALFPSVTGENVVVSRDPHLASFAAPASPADWRPTDIETSPVGPWYVDGGAVVPAEAFPALTRDALLLLPAREEGSSASLIQPVRLPPVENVSVRLKARNAAVLAGIPVTYVYRYCAASNVTVSVRPVDGNVTARVSRIVGREQADIVLDASRFAGEDVFIRATVRPRQTACGTDRGSAVHATYFGVEIPR